MIERRPHWDKWTDRWLRGSRPRSLEFTTVDSVYTVIPAVEDRTRAGDATAISGWKAREMSLLLEEIRYLHKRMQVIYEACGASCGNSVHLHRCMIPASQEHEAHICEDCDFTWGIK